MPLWGRKQLSLTQCHLHDGYFLFMQQLSFALDRAAFTGNISRQVVFIELNSSRVVLSFLWGCRVLIIISGFQIGCKFFKSRFQAVDCSWSLFILSLTSSLSVKIKVQQSAIIDNNKVLLKISLTPKADFYVC